MTRSSPRVRPATTADLPALVALGDELREQVLSVEGLRGRVSGEAARRTLRERYGQALADPDRDVVVVVQDQPGGTQEVLGMALLTVAPANALLDHRAVHLSHGVVADRQRRRGAGRALVAAAASYAEERGIDQLVVSVPPGARDANRFFARLGFAPLVVRRSAPVAAVRRRLADCDPVPAAPLVRRRRRPVRPLRGPLPLGPSLEEDG